MQTQNPPTPEIEKLFFKPLLPVRTSIDPNGALWHLLHLARKFEQMSQNGDLQMSSTAVKSVCDPHIPVAVVCECLGLDSIHPGPMGEMLKLWDNLYSEKLEEPKDVTHFIHTAYQLISQYNSSSQQVATNN